ncbi:MAG: PAS domain S-box protein, partial [Candidatus Firestonebacteria bacterium]
MKDNESRYKRLFDSLNDAVIVIDIRTHIIIDANEMAQKLTGRARGEIIGNDLSLLYSADEAGYYKEHFKKVVKDGSNNFEAAIVKKDGTCRTVKISSRVEELEGKKVIIDMFRDITETKAAAERIKTAETRHKQSGLEFRDYIDSTSDGVMIIDKNLNILNINQGGLKILEAGRENIVGKNLESIKFEMENRNIKDIYRRIKKPEKNAKSNLVTIKTKSGKKYIDIVAFKVKQGLGVSLRDVTLNHKLTELIRTQKKELE